MQIENAIAPKRYAQTHIQLSFFKQFSRLKSARVLEQESSPFR
jgi:hypothetical protein